MTTLEEKMDAFTDTETNAIIGAVKEEIVEVKNTDVLKVGQVYKITGGKWKKHKKAKLIKINKTYSDVYIHRVYETDTEIIGGWNPTSVKCKNCYLHPCDEIIEMPDADNLQVVDNSVDINKLYEEKHPANEPTFNVEEESTEDITDILPSIEEALALKEENARLKEQVVSLLKKIKAIKNVCEI